MFLLQRPQQHGLLIGSEFANFIQEEKPSVSRSQQTGAILHRASEGSFHMAEKGADGGLS